MINEIMDFFLNIDVYLNSWILLHGAWTYLLLFLVIFCETGLVITPFLPGDSLLFTAGSIAAFPDKPLDIYLLFFLLTLASILGNQVNYELGKFFSSKIHLDQGLWFIKKKHWKEAHDFYEKHGGKTIIFARFIPIIRTFIPFIAGVAAMTRYKFFLYNFISAWVWVGGLVWGGYFLGSLPLLKNHFSVVIYGIILLSLLPPIISYLRFNLGTKSR